MATAHVPLPDSMAPIRAAFEELRTLATRFSARALAVAGKSEIPIDFRENRMIEALMEFEASLGRAEELVAGEVL